MDKLQIIHDLAVTTASTSAIYNFKTEMDKTPEKQRRDHLANFIKSEYDYYSDYFKQIIK